MSLHGLSSHIFFIMFNLLGHFFLSEWFIVVLVAASQRAGKEPQLGRAEESTFPDPRGTENTARAERVNPRTMPVARTPSLSSHGVLSLEVG